MSEQRAPYDHENPGPLLLTQYGPGFYLHWEGEMTMYHRFEPGCCGQGRMARIHQGFEQGRRNPISYHEQQQHRQDWVDRANLVFSIAVYLVVAALVAFVAWAAIVALIGWFDR